MMKPQANYCTHKGGHDWLGSVFTRHQPEIFDAATSSLLWRLQMILFGNNSPYIILEINASAFLKGAYEAKWKSPVPKLGNPCYR